jgi:hypothetical protein
MSAAPQIRTALMENLKGQKSGSLSPKRGIPNTFLAQTSGLFSATSSCVQRSVQGSVS